MAQCVLLPALQALDNMLQDKNIKRPLNLVAHGFITGQYAATWALKNPDAIAKMVLLDMPFSKEVRCGWSYLDFCPHVYGSACTLQSWRSTT